MGKENKKIKNDIKSENFDHLGPKFQDLYTTRTYGSGCSKMFPSK